MAKKTYKFLGFNVITIESDDQKPQSKEPTEEVKDAMSKATSSQLVDDRNDVGMPVGTKRQTVESHETLFDVFKNLRIAKPEFDRQLIAAIKYLAQHHPDVSRAVNNITLANTEHQIEWSDGISDSMKKEMVRELDVAAKKWLGFTDGTETLKDTLFVQLAITGAISYEKIMNSKLDGIDEIEFPSPEFIYFHRDSKTNKWVPTQRVPDVSGSHWIERKRIGDYIVLNTNQYKYIALRRMGETPEGTPPFLAALNSILIQKNMVENVAKVVEKLGLLGFLKIMLNAPKRGDNETDDTYYSRLKTLISQNNPFAEAATKSGYMIGFKGVQEIELQGTIGEVKGAETLLNDNDLRVFAGLKMDPAFMGRNNTSTETFARVVLAVFGKDLDTYQQRVASAFEDIAETHLFLKGYGLNVIKKVRFTPAMIGDRVKHEQARKLKQDYAEKMRLMGIWDQQRVANELGEESPALPGPLSEYNPDGTVKVQPDPKDPSNPGSTDSNALINGYLFHKLGGGYPEFEYLDRVKFADCMLDSYDSGFWDNTDRDYWENYSEEIKKKYYESTKNVANRVSAALRSLDEGATEEAVKATIFFEMYNEWGEDFVSRIEPVLKKFVGDAYKYYRSNPSPMAKVKDIPDVVFNAVDLRVVEFFEKNDRLYLGKFITDSDVRKKVNNWIKKNYLEGSIPIGKKSPGIQMFKKEFSNLLNLKDWKIRQITSTTMNRMRNIGSIMYMHQAEIKEFEIIEAMDNRTCPYCQVMHGTRFEVAQEVNKIQALVESPPQSTPLISPFLTGLKGDNGKAMKPEEIKKLSSTDLQGLGIGAPSYHPECRGRVAAVLS